MDGTWTEALRDELDRSHTVKGGTAESCAGCRYGAFKPGAVLVGQCRRYPPVTAHQRPHVTPYADFPTVTPDDWCGEYRRG